MGKHTPGPWQARMQVSSAGRALGWIIEFSCGQRIGWASLAALHTATVRVREDGPTDAANAQLMAAAPDLLESLEDALAIFAPEPEQSHPAPKWESRARAAILKATQGMEEANKEHT